MFSNVDIAELESYVVAQRRYFHERPELSTKEEATTKAIMERLGELGVDAQAFNGITGCVATIKGKKPGKTVLLRADIDALPICEDTGLPFASHNSGIMHACGHDFHIAMLLGAAKLLSDTDFNGTVKLLFQPAEEDAVGAKATIAAGLLDEPVDSCFAMHINPFIKAGYANFQMGARMASCDDFVLTVTGLSSHAATPHLGRDAIAASACCVQALQSLVNRRCDPSSTVVASIGSIHGGMRDNVVCDEVRMTGTVRTFDPDIRSMLLNSMDVAFDSAAAIYGCQAALEFVESIPPTVNTSKTAMDAALDAAKAAFGEDNLVEAPAMAAAEDFGVFLERIPGVFGFIGVCSDDNPNSGLPLHNGKLSPDESVLVKGALMHAEYAIRVLA